MKLVMSICSLFMGTIVSVLFFARGPIVAFVSAVIFWAILLGILFLAEKREEKPPTTGKKAKWKSCVPQTNAAAPLHPPLSASPTKTNGDDIRAKTDEEMDQFMESVYVQGWLAGRMTNQPYEDPDFLSWIRETGERR